MSHDFTVFASITIVSLMFVMLRLTGAVVEQNRELSSLLRDRESQKFLH
jgi:hypothetical protein